MKVAYYMKDTKLLSIENIFKNQTPEKATMCLIVVELKTCLCFADRLEEIYYIFFA